MLELTGTEKQVKWANDIRDKFTAELERVNARITETDAPAVIKRIIKNVSENTLKNTTAHWWIENRHQVQIRISGHMVNEIFMGIGKYLGESLRALAFEDIRKACDRMEEIGFKDLDDEGLWVLIDQILQGKQPERSIVAVTKEEREAEAEFEAERTAACTIRPEKPKSELPVKILIVDSATYNFKGYYAIRTTEWNEDVSKKMKRLRFSWESGEWRKFYANSFSDWEERIVEAATILLNAGYIVEMPNVELKQRVINGEYEPLNTRVLSADKDLFSVYWDYSDGDFYSTVKKIKGAKWDSSAKKVKIPMSMFEEVVDFAESFNFKITQKGKELIEKAKIIKEKTMVVSIDPQKVDTPKPLNGQMPELKPEEVEANAELLDTD